jgi:hypothetical protein
MSESTMHPSETLAVERAAYERMHEELKRHHEGKFAVIIGEELKGTFDSFNAAARFAMEGYGRGPYLIRQVGAPTSMPLPASVAYRPLHAPTA